MFFLAGIGSFFSAVFLQIALWHLTEVKRPLYSLGSIFLGWPVITLLVTIIWGTLSPSEVLCSFVLTLCLSAAYVQTMPVLAEDIPSFRILFFLEDRSQQITPREEIMAYFSDQNLVTDKVQELIKDGLLQQANGEVQPTLVARYMLRFFRSYRNWLGLERLGG